MAKKKIILNCSDDMDEIDAELTAALNMLEGKNQQVAELLRSYDTPVSSAEGGAGDVSPAPQSDVASSDCPE